MPSNNQARNSRKNYSYYFTPVKRLADVVNGRLCTSTNILWEMIVYCARVGVRSCYDSCQRRKSDRGCVESDASVARSHVILVMVSSKQSLYLTLHATLPSQRTNTSTLASACMIQAWTRTRIKLWLIKEKRMANKSRATRIINDSTARRNCYPPKLGRREIANSWYIMEQSSHATTNGFDLRWNKLILRLWNITPSIRGCTATPFR